MVSVIRRNPDGTWHGDMLDGLAFVKAQQDHGARAAGARALLVGAGGAGSAIAIALLAAGVSELVVHDADASRVAALLDLLAGPGGGRVIAGPRTRPAATSCSMPRPWAWRPGTRCRSMLPCSRRRCSSAT